VNQKEVEKLGPGDMIRHKTNLEWAFIVHQNFGDRLTAVRIIELRDLKDWEVVSKNVPQS
jgi:hypothetical protein